MTCHMDAQVLPDGPEKAWLLGREGYRSLPAWVLVDLHNSREEASQSATGHTEAVPTLLLSALHRIKWGLTTEGTNLVVTGQTW